MFLLFLFLFLPALKRVMLTQFSIISNLVHTTRFWNNLHQVLYSCWQRLLVLCFDYRNTIPTCTKTRAYLLFIMRIHTEINPSPKCLHSFLLIILSGKKDPFLFRSCPCLFSFWLTVKQSLGTN